MQIIISISDSFYDRLMDMNSDNDTCSFNESALVEVIQNGTPLPQGHGKIIDVNDLLDRICLEYTDENREDNVGEIMTLEDIDFIPAIIEADKESEDRNERKTES